MSENRFFFILSGLWALVYMGSIVVLQTTEPTGDGFTRGLNRLTAFLSWQVFAAVIAVGVWIAGNGLPKGSQARLFSRIPAALAAILILVISGVIIFAGYGKPPAQEGTLNLPTTKPVPVAVEQTYRGYYRSGFEQSDFYPADGTQGPWWMEADGDIWQKINQHMNVKEGRGSFVTLKLDVKGTLEQGGRYGHLGAYRAKLTVSSITDLSPMSQDGFEAAVEALQKGAQK